MYLTAVLDMFDNLGLRHPLRAAIAVPFQQQDKGGQATW